MPPTSSTLATPFLTTSSHSPTRTKKEVIRADGRKVRFDDNACVLLNQKGEMVASRVFGIVGAEMRKSGRWGKIVSMAPKVNEKLSSRERYGGGLQWLTV